MTANLIPPKVEQTRESTRTMLKNLCSKGVKLREGAVRMQLRTKKSSHGHRPVHLSERPRAEVLDASDYSQRDLKFAVDASKEFVVPTRGWTPAPTEAPDLPFAVDRAGVGSGLPVYSEYKAGGTKVLTIVRKLRGDVHALKDDLEKIVDGREVRIRPGRLEVDGNYVKRVKKWLIGLGF